MDLLENWTPKNWNFSRNLLGKGDGGSPSAIQKGNITPRSRFHTALTRMGRATTWLGVLSCSLCKCKLYVSTSKMDSGATGLFVPCLLLVLYTITGIWSLCAKDRWLSLLGLSEPQLGLQNLWYHHHKTKRQTDNSKSS